MKLKLIFQVYIILSKFYLQELIYFPYTRFVIDIHSVVLLFSSFNIKHTIQFSIDCGMCLTFCDEVSTSHLGNYTLHRDRGHQQAAVLRAS